MSSGNGIVVMKFGGTSVADAEHIIAAARRIVRAREDGHAAWSRCSRRAARPPTSWCGWPTRSPRARTRARWTCCSRPASGSRARCARWRSTTSAARRSRCRARRPGIVTDTSHTKARILDVRADRIRAALEEGNIVLVAGFQGVSTSQERDDARPRRLRHDRGRAGGRARRRRVRDLHRRRRRLLGRPADRRRTRASCRSCRSRRCSRWPPRARRCCSCARSSTRATTASGSTCGRASETAPVPSCLGERRPWNDRSSQP